MSSYLQLYFIKENACDIFSEFLLQKKFYLFVTFTFVLHPYLDQWTSASHADHWSKSSFCAFYHFYNCCVFWPAFGCCAHPRGGLTTFLVVKNENIKSSILVLFCQFLTFSSEIIQKLTKNFEKSKKSKKEDKFEGPPQGVDQLLHFDQLWGAGKIWKKHFFVHFQTFFVDFNRRSHWKRFKITKKIENGRKIQHYFLH